MRTDISMSSQIIFLSKLILDLKDQPHSYGTTFIHQDILSSLKSSGYTQIATSSNLDKQVQFVAGKVKESRLSLQLIIGSPNTRPDESDVIESKKKIMAWESIYSSLRKMEIIRGFWMSGIDFDQDYPAQREISLCAPAEKKGS